MNHVLGTDIDDDRFVDEHVDFVERLDVVLAVRVGRVNAKDVVRLTNFMSCLPKMPSGPAIADVPGELLRHDLDDGGFIRGRELVHGPGPNRHGHADQQHGLDAGHGQFDVTRRVIFDTVVIGLGIARRAETAERVEEINDPADEQREHQPVDIDDQGVHGLAVFGGQFGQMQDIVSEPLGHSLGGLAGAESLAAFSALRTTWTKKTSDAGQHGQDDAQQGENAPVHAAGQRRIGFAIARGAGEQRRRREAARRAAADLKSLRNDFIGS